MQVMFTEHLLNGAYVWLAVFYFFYTNSFFVFFVSVCFGLFLLEVGELFFLLLVALLSSCSVWLE